MFRVLGALIAIGTLAWHSPARERAAPAPPAAGLDDLKRLDALWHQLPPAARREIVEQVARAAAPSQDTLRGADRHPAWRGTLAAEAPR